MPRTYHGVRGAAGALVFLERVRGAAYGEAVRIRVGDRLLNGQIVDACEVLTVVQVLEDPLGLAPAVAEVTLTGDSARAAVGRELLGRVLDGLGRPLDGLPAPVADALVPLSGQPINPVRRRPPAECIETGVSAIDGLNTLVRGQKLPIFSGAGLPGLALASRIVRDARIPGGEDFAVVFCGVGLPEREAESFLAALGSRERTVVVLNRAGDPTVERLVAPRLALAEAEHLAFTHGLHVLVVLADITPYCEAVRELAAARGEVPGRRGYPGFLYTDLASLFERAGLVQGRPGSVTQLAVLTMPDDDLTHPIPDLTGYITEGQIVLGRDLAQRGLSPPIDVLPSLSRLMNAGIGAGRTHRDHRPWANQLYASYAQGREARLMAGVVGRAGLSAADLRSMDFADRFEAELVHQPKRRTIAQTLAVGWRLLESLPRDDLTRLDEATWARRAVSS
jgi:V/A-type H+-transporting ATPase subunit B